MLYSTICQRSKDLSLGTCLILSREGTHAVHNKHSVLNLVIKLRDVIIQQYTVKKKKKKRLLEYVLQENPFSVFNCL